MPQAQDHRYHFGGVAVAEGTDEEALRGILEGAMDALGSITGLMAVVDQPTTSAAPPTRSLYWLGKALESRAKATETASGESWSLGTADRTLCIPVNDFDLHPGCTLTDFKEVDTIRLRMKRFAANQEALCGKVHSCQGASSVEDLQQRVRAMLAAGLCLQRPPGWLQPGQDVAAALDLANNTRCNPYRKYPHVRGTAGGPSYVHAVCTPALLACHLASLRCH